MNSSNLTTPPSKAQDLESQIAMAIFAVTLVLGVVGNGLVLLVVFGKGSRTVSDIFIMNLSISDLTFLILSLAVNTPNFIGNLVYSVGYCKFVWPTITVTFFASVFTLCAMAMHRCHGILNPLKVNLTERQAIYWAVGIWGLSFVPVFPLMVVTEISEEGCRENWSLESSKFYTVALFLLQYMIPLCVIAGAYSQIIRRLIQRQVPGSMLDENRHIIIRSKRKENNQIIKIVAVIVLLFAICMLPHELAGLMIFFGDETRRTQGQALSRYSPMLQYIHSCLNPMVYGVLTRQFCKEYQRYLLMLLCCCRYKKVATFLKKGSYVKTRSTYKTTLKQRQDTEMKQRVTGKSPTASP